MKNQAMKRLPLCHGSKKPDFAVEKAEGEGCRNVFISKTKAAKSRSTGEESLRLELSEDIGSLFTDNEKAEWAEIYTIGMTPCYASLVIIASHNWMPSTHSNHVSEQRAKLIYKLSTGVIVDFGQLVCKRLSLLDDDVLISSSSLSKDKRSGRVHKREERIRRRRSKQTFYISGPIDSVPAAQSTSEASFTVDLGSVRFPTPPIQPAAAIQALQDIVYTLQTFTDSSGLLANLKVLVRHKAKKGEIEDATGLTQIVNQSGSASGRMDGHVAELSGA
ncbi:unnamed protein product [Microthlaspi erraticum]|uniref:Uncharacterized protein n=1 Tax=Microthlaspi erraticum TaxID=1685480 RepID=A0A6D2I0S1_9BRAS|nr:unnamed protein product [Microthlaspi erraticum]